MKISENFTLEEFYYSSTADKYKIDNYPHNSLIKNNIILLILTIMQPIRDAYGKPINVSSGYRCSELNKKIGGSTTSQHMTGQAADIKCKDNAALFNVILDLIKKGKIKVGQLIWEYGNDKQPDWIHVSMPYNKENQILKAVKRNGKTTYLPYGNN